MFVHHPIYGDPETKMKADLKRANIKFTSLKFEEILTQPNGSKVYKVIVNE